LIANARGSDHRVGLPPCVSKICDTSHRRRHPKARFQSSISRETWAGAQRSRPAGVPRALGLLAPAVSEAGVVLDLVEGGVAGAATYARIFTALMPKQVEITDEDPISNLADEQLEDYCAELERQIAERATPAATVPGSQRVN
jgi:hypothetical protein